MTNENRNLLLAVVLSALVLFGWSMLSERYLSPPAPPAAQTTQTAASGEAAVPATASAPMVEGQVPTVAAAAPSAAQSLSAILDATPRVEIRTPRLSGSINLQGARIDDLVLRDYRQTVDRDSPPVRLFSPSGTADSEFVGLGWLGLGAPPADARWTASAPTLSPGKPVTLRWTSAEGLTFEQMISIDDNFLFTVEQRVLNGSEAAVALRPYGYVNRTGEGREQGRFNLHVGPLGVLDGSLVERDLDYKKLREKGPRSYSTTGGWLGITQLHWLAALIPDQKAHIEARFTAAPGDRYQVDWLQPTVTLQPGQAQDTRSHVFAGAKEVALLKQVRDELHAPLFDRALAWGWFWFLAQPIFSVLEWLYGLLGNYALAIVGLTLIVRTLLFPIANKQYASMAKMRVFAPRMKEIQEKYKDDKQKQQTAIMELYRREKINPLAGCLPVILQIPIFYALYKTLLIAVEIRHQPGFLWIRDLSAPDPLTPLNLFGLIPWDPPGFLHLGLLPILLGVTMWLQFKLNPQPMDEMQKKMFAFMPWVFMFMMAPFATGLQIYWIVNNILSIGQQWVLLRKYPSPASAPSKAG